MIFANFAQGLEEIEGVPARLEKTRLLAQLFKKLELEDIVSACYLMQGRLVPQYKSLEFQLSEKMIVRALARISESSSEGGSTNLFGEQDESVGQASVWKRYKQSGDLGQTAEQIASEANLTGRLDLLTVFDRLQNLATISGLGSQEKKLEILVGLFKDLDPTSVKYIVRIILSKMRLGFSTMTIIDSLSWAVVGDKSESPVIETAWQIKADIGKIAASYLVLINQTPEKRQQMLAQTQIEVGVPVMPALCQRLNSTSEMIEKMKEVIVEPKYDGLRIQLHFSRSANPDQEPNLIEVFTRSLENVTAMFPEVQQLPEILKCESCVLDAEAIGVDPKTGKLMAFQDTITRKRKHGVADQAISVPIQFFVFDVMSLNGQSLLSFQLLDRKAQLKPLFEDNNILVQVPFHITKDAEFLKKYHQELLYEGLEGAVMKKVDGKYVGGRKGWRWVKIKEVEGVRGKLKDTLDVIMMGYYQGRGKRSEFGLGAILAGITNKEGDVVTIAKIGTGMSENQLVELKKLADSYASHKKPAQYIDVDKAHVPDVWINPHVVLEIAADEITKSPNHGAKFALRFPRLIKIRYDKTWEQATNIEELKSIA